MKKTRSPQRRPPAPPAVVDRPKTGPWLVALASVLVLLVAFATRYLADADLGYHLRGGQWILQNHRFPSTDTYTFTRSNALYPDLHWIYQILIYLTYVVGGYAALTILSVLLVAIVFGITLKRLQTVGAPLWMSVVLLFVALLTCELRFQSRPELLTWIFMSSMLWVLESRANGGRKVLFLLPVIQLVWTNSEGLFGLGWGVMGSYVLSDLIHTKRIDKELWGYSLLAAASSLVNPYVLRGAALPFTYLATVGAENPFKQTIAEFQSPWSMGNRFTTPVVTLVTYKAYSVFLLAVIGATFTRRKVHELLIAAAFFYLSVTALRNVSLFVLATLPTAAAAWGDVKWKSLVALQAKIVAKPVTPILIALAMWGFALRAVTNAHYISEARLDRFGLGLDGETQPVRGAEFLVQHHLEGRILNHVNVGGWLDWQRPGQVFIDGRTEVMGDELYAESQSALRRGGLARLIAKYQPDIIFFNPATASQWIVDLNDMPDWRVAFVDEGACVFLRKDYAPEVPAFDEGHVLADRGLSTTANRTALAQLQQPGPSSFSRFVKGFVVPAAHPNGLQALALFFQYRRAYQMSEPLFLECIRRSGGAYYDFYFNVGIMYFSSAQYDKARVSMDRVLADDPDNVGAQQILQRLASPASPTGRLG